MPTRQITIGGYVFDVEDRYAEGHTVNTNEAGALNQTRAENLRNNFAGVVKKAVDDLNEDLEEGADPLKLDDEGLAAIRAEFASVAEKYEFGTRGGGVRIVDPVQREARRIATDKVHTAIKAKHGKLDAVPKDKIAELIDGYAAREDVQALAKANIEAANDLAAELDL